MNNNLIGQQNQIINFKKMGMLNEYFAILKIETLLKKIGISIQPFKGSLRNSPGIGGRDDRVITCYFHN